jgi:hypothetical protein
MNVAQGEIMVIMPLDPRFVVLNSGKDNGFLRVINIRSKTSFRREVKLSAEW